MHRRSHPIKVYIVSRCLKVPRAALFRRARLPLHILVLSGRLTQGGAGARLTSSGIILATASYLLTRLNIALVATKAAAIMESIGTSLLTVKVIGLSSKTRTL